MSRVMLIGLDGAEPTLIEPWMDSGELPALASLRARGCYMRCASTIPPATMPAWTTCVTGVNPGRHGIVDFTEMTSGRYSIQFVNSTYRQAPALWTIASQAGLRCCVLGVPGTYPPEAINGVMVSGFDSPVCTRVDPSFVYPSSEFATVKDWRFADFQETSIGPGWHEHALASLLNGIELKESIALELARREPWDFFMAVFGESDTVSHHFWLFHDADSPRHAPGFEDAILRVYKRLDAAVGRLIDAAGDAVVGVVSDHGFGGAGLGVIHLNNWLAENGHLAFRPDYGSFMKKTALALTPESWRSGLFRWFRRWAVSAESRSRFSGIDWNKTKAWSEELNYFPSIRVNLKGREPLGQVAPSDYDSFCNRLCDELRAWPMVAHAWRREELYAGAHVEKAPDIILELALDNGYSYSCVRSRGGAAQGAITEAERFGGKERGMTGNHRPMGIFLMSEPAQTGAASLQDIAPTVLTVLGIPAPPMDGTSLLAPPPYQQWNASRSSVQAYTLDQEAVIEARLRSLGYFE